MGIYSSWISVSNFMLTVEAENKEEARKKIENILNRTIITVIEKKGGYETVEKLGCKITDITEGVC